MNKKLSIIFATLWLCTACSTTENGLPITQSGSRYPFVAATGDGGVLMSWFEKTDSVTWALKWSEFKEGIWNNNKPITSGEPYFINWADFPSIFHLGGDTLAAHWLQKSGQGPYDYDVKVVRSFDRGATWSEPVTPHRDGIKGEHGFVSFFRDMTNDLGLVWLDARNMGAGNDGHGYGAMNLYQSGFMSSGDLKWEMKLDDMVCECCPTSAVNTDNSLLIAYRDRSEAEIRDIKILRYADGYWFEPYAVHNDDWKIVGCPVNGPKLAAQENDIAIAWFTSPDNTPKVNVAFSVNEGASFENPIRVDLNQPIGRVDLIWISDEEIMVSWIEIGEETTNILISIVAKNGSVGTPRIISEIAPGRVSGYPQMARVEDQIFFTWTEGGEEGGIQSKWIPLSVFR